MCGCMGTHLETLQLSHSQANLVQKGTKLVLQFNVNRNICLPTVLLARAVIGHWVTCGGKQLCLFLSELMIQNLNPQKWLSETWIHFTVISLVMIFSGWEYQLGVGFCYILRAWIPTRGKSNHLIAHLYSSRHCCTYRTQYLEGWQIVYSSGSQTLYHPKTRQMPKYDN